MARVVHACAVSAVAVLLLLALSGCPGLWSKDREWQSVYDSRRWTQHTVPGAVGVAVWTGIASCADGSILAAVAADSATIATSP